MAATHTGVWVAFIALMLVAWRLSEWITWRGKYGLGNDLEADTGERRLAWQPAGLLEQMPAAVEADMKSVRGSETSKSAAASVETASGTQRMRVMAYILAMGGEGATDHEMQAALSMNPSTQRPRRIELVEAGNVKDSGRSRPSPSGRQSIVWVSADTRLSLF